MNVSHRHHVVNNGYYSWLAITSRFNNCRGAMPSRSQAVIINALFAFDAGLMMPSSCEMAAREMPMHPLASREWQPAARPRARRQRGILARRLLSIISP